MKKKTVTTKLPAGEIVEIRKLADGTLEVVQSVAEIKELVSVNPVEDNPFVLIEAESLSLEDKFMQYEPKTEEERRTKELITKAIKRGVKNFYHPKYEPSFDEDGNICFVAGKKPAVGLSYDEWFNIAYNYKPECDSHLGVEDEYSAFVGVLMKKLVEEGRSIEWIWNVVCNDSKELGDFYDWRCGKSNLELTGSRCVCGFGDIANTYKLLHSEIDWFGHEQGIIAGGITSGGDTIAIGGTYWAGYDRESPFYNKVGWFVFARCPT